MPELIKTKPDRKKACMKFLYSEKFFLIAVITATILFNLAPYIYQNYFYEPPRDKTYIGSYPIVMDKPVYLSAMAQGEEGGWKLTNKYTTEPQKETYVYIFYLLLGHIAKILNSSIETAFLISRFVFGIILLLTTVYFIRFFVSEAWMRKIAYFFAFFASGLGWLTQNIRSPDLWISDAIPMVRFSYFPHMMLGNILMLWSLLLIYRSLQKQSAKLAAKAGVLTFILNLVLTFHSALLYPLILLYAAAMGLKKQTFSRKNFQIIALFLAISLPSFFYMYYLGKTDPIWLAVEKQNILITPSLKNLASGYGLILIFSILGIKKIYKEDNSKGLFFFLWILAVLIGSHIPTSAYPMQRRFLETAFYVPLAITASYGVKMIYCYFEKRKTFNLNLKFKMFFAMFAVPILTVGNVQNLMHYGYSISGTNNPKFYIPSENVEAMKWLRENSPSQSVVLSDYYNGNLIPYYASRFVYAGHAPSTLDYGKKISEIDDFYSGKYSDAEIFDFLKEKRINYVFYSSLEIKQGKFNPKDHAFLREVYPHTTNPERAELCTNDGISDDKKSNQHDTCEGVGIYKNKELIIYEFNQGG